VAPSLLLLPLLLALMLLLFMPNAPRPHPEASQLDSTEAFSFSKSGQMPLAASKSAVI